MPKHSLSASTRLIARNIVLQRKMEAVIEKKTAWSTKYAHVYICLQICRYIKVDCMSNESSFCGKSQESQWDIQDASWDSSCFPPESFITGPMSAANTSDSKQFMTINYLRPRSNKHGLLHDVMIQMNLSVHHKIYVPINKY